MWVLLPGINDPDVVVDLAGKNVWFDARAGFVVESCGGDHLGLMGFDQAIMTSGGVDLKEIDSRTMKSKIIENLFFAGEIIDLDGPTGGYNLQICWTAGYIAGSNAAGKI